MEKYDFTGIDSMYKEPSSPFMSVDTTEYTITESIDLIYKKVFYETNYILLSHQIPHLRMVYISPILKNYLDKLFYVLVEFEAVLTIR